MTLVVRNRNLNGGYNPHIDLGSVFEEILRFDPFAKRSHSSRDDRVSIRDLEDRHEISIAAPGLKKADFNIQLKADRLSISYDASADEDENSRRTFSKSAFYKAYSVPEGTVPEDIKAKYSAGILKVIVNRPKVEVPTEHNIKIN
jgi:HSP20 family protein